MAATIGSHELNPAELLADGCLSVRQAVEFSGISRARLYLLMNSGKIRYLVDGRRLIPRRELVAYLESLAICQGPIEGA